MHLEARGAVLALTMVALLGGGLLATGSPRLVAPAMAAADMTRTSLTATQARLLRDEVLASRASRAAMSGRSLGEFEVTCYVLEGTTASGLPAGPEVVAVDPTVVPLGSRVMIEGLGGRVAADTGRLIRGRRLDVWMDDLGDCVQFGRRVRHVYLG